MKKGVCFLYFDGEMIERKPFDSRYDIKKIIMVNNKSKIKRDDIVPFYVKLIESNPNEEEIKLVNNAILSKWSPSGLLYIKDKAWKMVNKQKTNT